MRRDHQVAQTVRPTQRAKGPLVDQIGDAGELLPGDGPAEWVVGPRRWLTGRYTDVCARLATALIEADSVRDATRVARSGLGADRYRDDLWKVLIDAAERAGNHAEAESARREYESLLNDLGV